MFSRKNILFSLVVIAAILVVIGARWKLIGETGSPIPFYDQWTAEGKVLYQPAVNGTIGPGSFFERHNDHHIVPTRLLAYGLFEGNGKQWDVRLQMTVNALLAAVILLPLLALIRPWFAPPVFVAAAGGLAWLYAQPIFYENALWGFQSQFYFLILFSLLQIRGMLTRPALSLGWWLGLLAGVGATGSMGSGLIASAAVLGLTAWRGLTEPYTRRPGWPTMVAAGLILLAGIWWLPPLSPGEHVKAAASLKTFFHALAFPDLEFSWIGFLFWMPFLVFAFSRLVARAALSVAERVLLGSGGWVLLQIAALAYARGESGGVLANRYNDVLVVGTVVNLATLGWLWSRLRTGNSVRLRLGVCGALTIAWVGFAGVDAVSGSRGMSELLPYFRELRKEHIERIGAFVQTNDAHGLMSVAYPHVPADTPARLVEYLRTPELRDVLPFEVRRPIYLNFPVVAGQPGLSNALPVNLPNEAGRHHRGTYFPGEGAAGKIDAISRDAAKKTGTSLSFKVAGDLRRGETELRVRDAAGKVVAVITDLKSEVFTPIEVRVPGTAFSVEVFDQSPEHWLAFLEPTEVGPLSHWSLRALQQAARLEWLGVILLGGIFWGSVGAMLKRAREQRA